MYKSEIWCSMDQPSLSVIIPVYNRPRMIESCLLSLAPGLGLVDEVIVVDDGSSDGETPAATESVIRAIETSRPEFKGRIRLVRQENAGPGAARNNGARQARGRWISFLDSDDCWLPWSAQALLAAITRNGDAAAIFANTLPFVETAELPDKIGVSPWVETPTVECHYDNFHELDHVRPVVARLGAGYLTIRRDVFLAHDGFVAGLKGSEDTDLFYRIAYSGPFVALKDPVVIARRTSNSDSLARNMVAAAEGLAFLLEGRLEGRYPTVLGGKAEDGGLDRSLGYTLNSFIHAMFWDGYGREGYGLLLRRGGFRVMLRGGYSKQAFKLLFIPLLGLVRPKNHRFRWTPKN